MRTLLINSKNLSEFGGTLLSLDYGYATVTTYEDWLRNSKQPLYHEQTEQYSTAIITILMEAESNVQLDINCSNLIRELERSIVKDTQHSWYLDGHFVESADNRISPYARELEIQFNGCKYSGQKTITHTFEFNQAWEFTCLGNLEVPCKILISPDMGYTHLDLKVNGTNFRINNISSSDLLLTIDGINGTITVDGDNKIEDYEPYTFPTIKGGSNTISVNGAPTISIVYNGRWM